MTIPQEVLTAYHEAGHFVAHRHLMPNGGTIAVSIVRNEEIGILGAHSPLYGLEGRLRQVTPEEAAGVGIPTGGYIEEFDPVEVENEVIVLYAGAAAELRLDPSRSEAVRLGGGSDSEKAAGLLGNGIPGEYPGLGRPDLEPTLRARAGAFVAERWHEIEALAAELLERKMLDGTEAELVIDAAAGDPDARAGLERYRRMLQAASAPSD